MKNILPLGSVVLLKDSSKRLMIYGRMQKEIGTDKIWDYIGCLYPEGSLESGKNFLFDEEQIHLGRIYNAQIGK